MLKKSSEKKLILLYIREKISFLTFLYLLENLYFYLCDYYSLCLLKAKKKTLCHVTLVRYLTDEGLIKVVYPEFKILHYDCICQYRPTHIELKEEHIIVIWGSQT